MPVRCRLFAGSVVSVRTPVATAAVRSRPRQPLPGGRLRPGTAAVGLPAGLLCKQSVLRPAAYAATLHGSYTV